MSTEQEPELEPEIAHVLLIDVVGYSKLLVNAQIELLQELNRLVRGTAHFRAAENEGKLMRLPTGDGMALLFFGSAEAPLHCALEISRAAKDHPEIELRMGAHSGPIRAVQDVNDRANFAGTGLNIAQRVLDCGDAGHILVSKRLADDLSSYRHWHAYLNDLGECEVKHGLRLHLFNLCKNGLGNPALPQKLKQQRGFLRKWRTKWGRHSRTWKVLTSCAALAVVAAAVTCFWLLFSGGPDKESIAVLPFSNQSDEKSSADFTRGVHDELLTGLAQVSGLKVISDTSVTSYNPDAPRNIREIAKALGVSYLLEGSVRTSGNRVRVYAQLIDGQRDSHVWAARYEREIKDIFTIQSEIAEEIVSQLRLKISSEEKAAIEQPPTRDLAAYDLYVRAKDLIAVAISSARGSEDLNDAARLLNEAVTRDPSFFRAHFQLAHAYDQLSLRLDHNPGFLALAESSIQKMVRLRPDAGETHLAAAKHAYWGYRDYEKARKELGIAQRQLPNDPEPVLLLGYLDRRQGHWEDALQALDRALELDPRNIVILQQLSLCYASLRRFEEMAQILDRAVSLAPNDVATRARRASVDVEWRADTKQLHSLIESAVAADPASAAILADRWLYLTLYERDGAAATRALTFLGANGCHEDSFPFPRGWCEGQVARLKGNREEAQAAFIKARAEASQLLHDQPDNAELLSIVALLDAALGNKEQAILGGRRAVEILPVEKDAINGAALIESLAIIYAWTGEKDLAIEQVALLVRTPSYVSYGNLRLLPQWDALRGDPRFEQIVSSLAPR